LRVLYFTQGWTAHDRRFVEALAQSGNQILLLQLDRALNRGELDGLPQTVQRLRWEGAPTDEVQGDLNACIPALRRILADERPDVLHAGPIQGPAWLAARAAPRNIPLVSMSWGSDLLVQADRDDRMRVATLDTLGRTDALVADCQTVKNKAVGLGFDPEKVVVFPWGVDLRHFSPGSGDALRRKLGWEHARVLLCLRSWEPLYGVDVVAKAFVQVAPILPDVRLLLYGAGSQRAVIRGILERGGVLDKVYFGARVELAELPGIYRAADLYLSGSHSDGSSVSLMEAMACGAPAVVSDIPSNREWIRPEENGWLFADGDEGVLASEILRACASQARLVEIGRAARATAQARADWDMNFPKLLGAYQIAIQARKSKIDERES
jgi:L-malate glycosyltransferase